VLLEADKVRHTADESHDIPGETGALISAKDETIRVLREQLEAEREASAELRRIVAGLVQRVPELEAPAEPREAPEAASEGSGGTQDRKEQQETMGDKSSPPGQRRGFWARLFGGG
jgi:septal ring factor EnvC (AmiA/AmiB activator)